LPYNSNIIRIEKAETTGRKHAPLENRDSVSAAHVVGDFGSEVFVVHQEKVDFPHIVDQEFLEAVRKKMACL
jgi:hypothetical protein